MSFVEGASKLEEFWASSCRLRCYEFGDSRFICLYSNNHSNNHHVKTIGSLEASLAPHGVILYLDHTDGVRVPRLEHVSDGSYGVLLDVILQNVIIIMITSPVIASCNYYVPVISGE